MDESKSRELVSPDPQVAMLIIFVPKESTATLKATVVSCDPFSIRLLSLSLSPPPSRFPPPPSPLPPTPPPLTP
jgi:hypothetical protein